MNKNQIFAELKVVELAAVLAGPSVGQFFAELGADVIKVENPSTGGDVTRSWKLASEDPNSKVSSYFASANWGKEHVFINLKTDVEKIYELVKNADIVITSFKPGDATKLKVDYETLKKIKRDIIYGNISGYGEEDSRVGYDAILQAETGFMYMNGDPESLPTKMPVAIVDIVAAHQLKQGILSALYNRQKTGEGAFVQVSLFDSALATLANQGTNYLNANHIPTRTGSEHPNIVPYGKVFRTSDKRELVLAVGSDRQFKSLCEILGLNDVPDNIKFNTNANRVLNRKEIYQLLEMTILKIDYKKLMKELIEHKIPAGPVNSMQDLFELEMAQKMILTYDKDNLKGIRNVAFKMK